MTHRADTPTFISNHKRSTDATATETPERNAVVGKEETLVLTLIRQTKGSWRGRNVWEFTGEIKCDGGQTEAGRFHSAHIIFRKQSEQVEVIYNLQ